MNGLGQRSPGSIRAASEAGGRQEGTVMVRWLVVAILGLVGSAPLFAQAGGDLKTGELNPSALCGECHEEIYDMWRRSMHSAAYSDPIFQASYMRAYRDTGGEARRICLRCHAPAATHSGDLDMSEPASREGITCDFCHSISAVDVEQNEHPIQIVLDGVKRGPLGDADSPAHRVARSALHEAAEICAGCHEYTNANGLPILTTYSEWLLSPQAAEGKSCQNCHMPLGPGETVTADFGLNRKQINLHNISGGHSNEQVRKAATVRILGVRKDASRSAVIEVEVANVGSGHSIPTGLPTRKLVLEVTLFSGDRMLRRFERLYQKRLLDEAGQLIVLDHRAMLNARGVLEDTRLHPGERRVERFVTDVPRQGTLRAEAKLRYVYEPELLSRTDMSIEMASDHTP
jgi:hypothetical protein